MCFFQMAKYDVVFENELLFSRGALVRFRGEYGGKIMGKIMGEIMGESLTPNHSQIHISCLAPD